MDLQLNIRIIRSHESELYILCNTKRIDKSFNIHYFRHRDLIKEHLSMNLNNLVNNVI